MLQYKDCCGRNKELKCYSKHEIGLAKRAAEHGSLATIPARSFEAFVPIIDQEKDPPL